MSRKRVSKSKKVALPILNPNAAGIDIGATEIYVAVPPDRDTEPVRMFPSFTEDLNALADWLQKCGIRTVAIIDEILTGERDVNKLAALRDPRVRATQETIAKSLVGDYREEPLFTLEQSVALYREYQRKIVDCEAARQRLRGGLERKPIR
jgi:hypothetical protein